MPRTTVTPCRCVTTAAIRAGSAAISGAIVIAMRVDTLCEFPDGAVGDSGQQIA